jgi:hypothetical protein
MSFKDELITLGACKEAIKWVGDKPRFEVWETCRRGDWMLWVASKKNVDRKLLVLAACDCAELADKYLNDKSREPARKAIAMARAWCNGEVTTEEVKHAADAATYVADAAYSTAVNYATYAAAYAAYAASANAAYAADAADVAAVAAYAAHAAEVVTYAADAAAYATDTYASDVFNNARYQTLVNCADIVRKYISWEVLL